MKVWAYGPVGVGSIAWLDVVLGIGRHKSIGKINPFFSDGVGCKRKKSLRGGRRSVNEMNTNERPRVGELGKLVGQLAAVNKIAVGIQLVLLMNLMHTLSDPGLVTGTS